MVRCGYVIWYGKVWLCDMVWCGKVWLYNWCGYYIPSLQGSKRVVMMENYTRFSEYIAHSELKLPSGTLSYEEDMKVRS